MLKGRTAIVTGSTSGIGLGIAEGLAKAGVNVVLNGIEPEAQVAPIRERLAAHGVEVRYDPANMMDPDAIAAMIERTGEVDILVNNAGIQHVAAVEEFPPAKWDAIIAVNLTAAFHTTRAVVAGMKARGWGRVLNVASAHGHVASPYKSAYVAAKHGIVGFTKTVALETATSGVTVNAICPGYVLTPLVENQIPDTARARGISEDAVVRDVMLAHQPTKRFVTVDEVAALALFLCSDGAASMTGAAYAIDGGWTAQ